LVRHVASRRRQAGRDSRLTARPGVQVLEGRVLPAAAVVKPIAFSSPGAFNNLPPVYEGGGLWNSVALNGTFFFPADDGVHGLELWRSDGTPAGTALVKDIAPGAPGSSVSRLTAVSNKVFFSADDGIHGLELWTSDGTAAGTALVKDIAPGAAGPRVDQLTAVGNTLFFTTGPAENTPYAQLWKSDGTAAGTVPVTTVHFPYIQIQVNVNGTLYFAAPTSASGQGIALWKTDGTAAGTTAVKTINTVGSFGIVGFWPVGGTLYFAGNDGVHGYELWKSDGTAAGTAMVKDINPGGGDGIDFSLTAGSPSAAVSGKLFFVATDGHGAGLWKTDGTAAGTVMVKAGPSFAELTAAGNVLLFRGKDGAHGKELWKSDGTAAGTALVKDIFPGAADASPTDLTNVAGTVYFAAFEPNSLHELWKSDGTAAGTALVMRFPTVAGLAGDGYGPNPGGLKAVNNALFFTADDAVHGRELWKSNGTSAGTVLVKDINAQALPAAPSAGVTAGGITYFTSASDPAHDAQLWRTDGTAAGTAMVTGTGPAVLSDIRLLTNIGATVFFTGIDAHGILGLWKTTGTAAGTALVKPLEARAGAWTTYVDGGVAVGHVLLFELEGGANHRLQLWTSDGTAAGTGMVKDLASRAAGGLDDLNMMPVGNTLFFTALGNALWKSDGTAAGTTQVKVLSAKGNAAIRQLTAVGSTLFFSADDGVHGRGLWKSDGTAKGTVGVKYLAPGSVGPFPVLNGAVYFPATDAAHGTGLWKSDGTANGTVFVKAADNILHLTAVNGRLLFSAADQAHGQELWTSDGTAAGTAMVKDLNPSPNAWAPGTTNSSWPDNFVRVNGAVYFAADDGARRGLWRTDGTAAGTALVKGTPDAPFLIGAANGTLFFSATDDANGTAVWKLPANAAG